MLEPEDYSKKAIKNEMT